MSDAGLIRASLDDPPAFAGVYDRHAGALAGYLVRRTGRADGETLLGELFRIAFETRHRYQLDREDARPWLYGIAANLVMKHHRTEGRRRRATERLAGRRDTEPPFDEQVVASVTGGETFERVMTALVDLSEDDREAVLLYGWEDLSYAQIAEALEIPVGTVRSRIHRARVRLRELSRETGEEPDVTYRRAEGRVTR